MSTNIINPMSQAILDALPTKFYVIDINTKTILQTNDKTIKPGSFCHTALFNSKIPCTENPGNCICRQASLNPNELYFKTCVTKEGGNKHSRVKSSWVNDQHLLVTLDEDTEFLKKKQAFEFNAKRLERAEQLVQFGYWEYDLEKSKFTASLGTKLIYGIETNTLSYEELESFNIAEDKELFKHAFFNLIEKRKGFDIKFQIRRLFDGEIRTLRAVGNLNNKKTVAFGIVHDITEKEKVQQLRREHQKYLALLFENMSSAFAQHRVVNDDKGNLLDAIIIDVNPSYEQFFNLRKEEVQHCSIKKIFPELGEKWMARFAEVALSGKPKTFLEYLPWLDKHVEIAAYAPKKGYFVTNITDVTHRVQSEKELKIAKEKAVESDRLKTLFLANMSHEIRTPLNGILGFSNLLSQSGLTDENRLYYGKIIENSGKRLMTIIDDIIDVAMIQSGQIEFNCRAFDANDLLLEIYNLHLKQNEEKLKRIEFCIKECDAASLIYSDRSRIYQVLNNLLDNAFKFTQHGKVEFGISRISAEQVDFFVKDTGVGIEKEKHKYIFDSFRQAEEGQARAYEGFGLGLTIVAGVVDKLKGQIKLNSEYGKGAEFIVSIPRNNDKIATSENEIKQIGVGNKKKANDRKVVVSIEDEPVSINLLRTIVERKGYEIINFINPQEGIGFIRKNSADLVLMDVGLPQMNGYEATRIIKQEFPHIPVVIQTAFAMVEDRKTAMEAGCDDIIAKPYTIDMIHQKLNKYLLED